MFSANGGDQLLRSAQRDDAAVIHDGDAVAQALGLIHVVRGENDGAARLLELVDQVPQMAARLGIEAGGRLVEKQQLRIADQRAGHGQPLLLPAGESCPRARCASLRAARCESLRSTEMPR